MRFRIMMEFEKLDEIVLEGLSSLSVQTISYWRREDLTELAHFLTRPVKATTPQVGRLAATLRRIHMRMGGAEGSQVVWEYYERIKALADLMEELEDNLKTGGN